MNKVCIHKTNVLKFLFIAPFHDLVYFNNMVFFLHATKGMH